jgi:hypothetical protein
MQKTFERNAPFTVKGFIVPLEFIQGMSLLELERTLGIAIGQLDRGAAFALLNDIPAEHELQYFGDTRLAEHRFVEMMKMRMKSAKPQLNHEAMSHVGYGYIRIARPKLIKVVPIKTYDRTKTDDENWPAGYGAMQYKLLVPKQGRIVDLVESYPQGRFTCV